MGAGFDEVNQPLHIAFPIGTKVFDLRNRQACQPGRELPIDPPVQPLNQSAKLSLFQRNQRRLISLGNRPYLITSPSALREVHLLLVLALVFDDFSTSLNETFAAKAADYRALYDAEWGRLAFAYDSSNTGKAGASKRRPAVPSVWLCSRR